MSAFEKMVNADVTLRGYLPSHVYKDWKRGWKAALEWIIKIADEIDEQDHDISPRDIIEEELEKL
jgi:hypothetical protein